jgi:uncharacterized membrane protein YhaH (DUF805 family)
MAFVRYLFSPQGRIGRLQWWLGGIAQLLLAAPFALLIGWGVAIQNPFIVLGSLLFLPVLAWSGVCLTVKRLHDHDKSGWWLFIYMIPIIGAIWQLIECGLMTGTTGENDFGPDPLFSFNVDEEISALRAQAEQAPAVAIVPVVVSQPARVAFASERPVFGKRV